MTGLLYLSAIFRTSRKFCMETGCPPAVLLVIVTMMNGMRSLCSCKAFSSFTGSTLPLKGISNCVCRASSIVQSSAIAFRLSICPLVVSK